MREEYEAWFIGKFGYHPMPIHSRVLDFCWEGYQAGVESMNKPVNLSEWQKLVAEAAELRQQLAELKKQNEELMIELCPQEHEMKFYTDLEGKIEAQPGDLVALAVSEYGGMLHQPEVSKRPRLSADGKSAMFDWKEGEGGPFMVSLEE